MIRFVDFDGCLAYFDYWRGPDHFGAPVPEMVKKIIGWHLGGDLVVIYTARLTPGVEYGQTTDVEKTRKNIEEWCVKHLGVVLPVTNIKSNADIYYDDRCSRIIQNTGLTLEEKIHRMARDELVSNSTKQDALGKILTFLKEVDREV